MTSLSTASPIGVIAGTYGLLCDEALCLLADCEVILRLDALRQR